MKRLLVMGIGVLALAACASGDPPIPTRTTPLSVEFPTATPTTTAPATPELAVVPTPTPPGPLPTADDQVTVGVGFNVQEFKSALVMPARLLIQIQDVDLGGLHASLRLSMQGQQTIEISLSIPEDDPVFDERSVAEYGGYTVALQSVTASPSGIGLPSTLGVSLLIYQTEPVVDANTRFAFDLLHELRAGDQTNLFFSPLSISMALAMTYDGASGETKAAMAEVLHLTNLGDDAVNQGNADLLTALGNRAPELNLSVANSLWSREGVTLNRSFIDRVERYYAAEVTSLPFDEAATERINSWVSDKTNGKIDGIIDEIDPSGLLYLINAIYLKASWTPWPFDEEDTHPAPFQLEDGTQVLVPMMSRGFKTDYLDGDGFTALRLPYAGSASAYFFLPDRSSNLDGFLEQLNADAWATWMDDFIVAQGPVNIPRFEVGLEVTLNDVLKAMGMEVAFGVADFSAMGLDGAFISEVKHKAVVEVHETGTEAAGATSVAIALSGTLNELDFTLDRPFFFAITDDVTGSILFMGSVREMQAAQ